MRGSCLCGTVEYEVAKFSSPIQHCSCRTCRKAHAAAFSTGAAALRRDFRWLKGEGNLNFFTSSPGKNRLFCKTCGTQLIADYPDKQFVIVRVATLDEDPGCVPERQIWASQQAPWLHYGADVVAYPEWQPGKR